MGNEPKEPGIETTVVVLFNLKPGTDVAAYEHWARTTDLPIVRQLASVHSFEALRTEGLLGSEGRAPFQYVEVLKIKSLELLGREMTTETMQRVVKEFGTFADRPAFMLSRPL